MTGLADGMATAGNKKMFPLTHNSVRVIAGTESFESNVDHINKTAIILQVEENNHVTIKPYKDIEVTQIDVVPIHKGWEKQGDARGIAAGNK